MINKAYNSILRFTNLGWFDALFLQKKIIIPKFPRFKLIEYSDKDDFERLTHKYEPYSDFNFNSFYSWDTNSNHAISELNGNLVIRITDYITGQPRFSFIGTHRVDSTMKTLIEYSEKNGAGANIHLVPEENLRALDKTEYFEIEEDPNNFDYIFSISELSQLNGKKFKSKRRAAKKCAVDPNIVIEDMSKQENIVETILATANKWAAEKNAAGKNVDMSSERIAIKRILDRLTDQDRLLLTVAKKNDEIVGFSIDELLPNKFVLSHYFKTLPTICGLAEYLNREVAVRLTNDGYEYWNWEQDLGLESLKRMKLSHHPIAHKKKFIVRKKLTDNNTI